MPSLAWGEPTPCSLLPCPPHRGCLHGSSTRILGSHPDGLRQRLGTVPSSILFSFTKCHLCPEPCNSSLQWNEDRMESLPHPSSAGCAGYSISPARARKCGRRLQTSPKVMGSWEGGRAPGKESSLGEDRGLGLQEGASPPAGMQVCSHMHEVTHAPVRTHTGTHTSTCHPGALPGQPNDSRSSHPPPPLGSSRASGVFPFLPVSPSCPPLLSSP